MELEGKEKYSENKRIHQTSTTHPYKTIPIFTQEECQLIIDKAEWKALNMGWKTSWHSNYPTMDLPIVKLLSTLDFLKLDIPAATDAVWTIPPGWGEEFKSVWWVCCQVRCRWWTYRVDTFRDGRVLSFNIALNGGGAWFALLDGPVTVDQGEIVTHSSCCCIEYTASNTDGCTSWFAL